MLADIAMEYAREDGWTLLSIAGNHLNQLIPDEFPRMKIAHGEGSLHKLIVTRDLFDVRMGADCQRRHTSAVLIARR